MRMPRPPNGRLISASVSSVRRGRIRSGSRISPTSRHAAIRLCAFVIDAFAGGTVRAHGDRLSRRSHQAHALLDLVPRKHSLRVAAAPSVGRVPQCEAMTSAVLDAGAHRKTDEAGGDRKHQPQDPVVLIANALELAIRIRDGIL
jgi:hypothetical protein